MSDDNEVPAIVKDLHDDSVNPVDNDDVSVTAGILVCAFIVARQVKDGAANVGCVDDRPRAQDMVA